MELRETVCIESGSRVDREAGVIYGVKLLGEHSKNGRRYTPEAMRQAVELYEGAKLFVDHPSRESVNEDRKFADWGGVFRSVSYREGQGIFANEHLRKSCQHFEGILDAAENFPNEVGHSHVVDADARLEGGTEIVESILEVFSVDLVTDPATTSGMFESRSRDMAKQNDRDDKKESTKQRMSLRRIVESTPSNAKRHKLLAEMLDGESPMAPPEMEVEVEPEASPEDKIKEGLMAAIVAKLDSASDDQLKAVMKALELDDSLTTNAGATGGGSSEDDGGETSESVARKIATLEAKNLLLESGREATDVRVRALAAAADGDRKALLESWPVKETGSRKQGDNRPDSSPPIRESDDGDGDNGYDEKYRESVKRAKEKLASGYRRQR